MVKKVQTAVELVFGLFILFLKVQNIIILMVTNLLLKKKKTKNWLGKSPIVQAHSVFHIEIDRYFSDNILNFSHKRSFPRRDIWYFTTYTCKLKISIGELVWMYIAISIFSLKFECMCMLACLLGEVRVGFYRGLYGKIKMKLSIWALKIGLILCKNKCCFWCKRVDACEPANSSW